MYSWNHKLGPTFRDPSSAAGPATNAEKTSEAAHPRTPYDLIYHTKESHVYVQHSFITKLIIKKSLFW